MCTAGRGDDTTAVVAPQEAEVLPVHAASHAGRPIGRTAAAALLAVGVLAGTPAMASTAAAAPGSAWGSIAAPSVPQLAPAVSHLDPGLRAAGGVVERVLVTASGGVHAAADAVRSVGGRVGAALPLVDGVAAAVPAARLAELSAVAGVLAVTKDRHVSFTALQDEARDGSSPFTATTQATAAWGAGNRGRGVGIAVLDTGVSSVDAFAGRLVHGPDLSGEGTTVDTFGHGTVMAGLAAGRDTDRAGLRSGVAPEATVVAVKVAGRNGAVDVSTILQGMHWVSAYAEQYGIRVLNLSWGTASTQDPAVDPLNHAVQRLWQQGIVVVVSAGNSGPAAGTIAKPGDDPMVLTVGAYDDKGDSNTRNDTVPAWSSRGPTAAGLAKPDLVAPGRTLVTAGSPGSAVMQENPKALLTGGLVKGSGTSQAAAVTSGLAALVVAAHPTWTPDQVKRVLTRTASPLTSAPSGTAGAGRVQLAAALTADPGPAVWQRPTATGLGSLEDSRGGSTVEVVCPGATEATPVLGEVDVRCEAWDAAAWTGSRWNGDAWTGSRWNDAAWTGSRWNGESWTGGTWSGGAWSDQAWTGSRWNGSNWTGSRWNGSRWNGSRWNGSRWNGSRWNGSRWNGSRWNSTLDVTQSNDFLTAFWGQRPKAGLTLPGETSDAE